MNARRSLVAVLVGALGLLALGSFHGCGVLRPGEPGAPLCASFKTDIQPLLQRECGFCHVSRAAGGYQLTDYQATMARRDDGSARVVAGDRDSLLLRIARNEVPAHTAGLPEGNTGVLPRSELARLEDWAVRCRAAPGHTKYHPLGWASPTDTQNSHAVQLRDAGYDPDGGPTGLPFVSCRRCHGADLDGGFTDSNVVAVSCGTCHQDPGGPLACTTCHGEGHGDAGSPAPPRALDGSRLTTSLGVGAHRQHRAFECTACHVKVKDFADEGHLYRNGVFRAGQAGVVLASNDAGVVSWDRDFATCTNTACHAPGSTDTAATHRVPTWTRVDAGEAQCGSCHGKPPSNHADGRCELCHAPGYADGGVDLSRHLNGSVDLKGNGQCDGCHAGAGSAAFFDLQGSSRAGVRPVGAHQAHLSGHRLRGPLGCEDCHLVPEKVTSPGHIDSKPPAKVFNQTGPDAGLAFADGAQPTWESGSGTCANVYCHGGGAKLRQDSSPWVARQQRWTDDASAAGCSSCHGLPPRDGRPEHLNTTPITCYTCHGRAIDSTGRIIFHTGADGGLTSEHLDGKNTGN